MRSRRSAPGTRSTGRRWSSARCWPAPSHKLTARAASIGQQWTSTAFPTEFLALGGQGTGVPVRATVTSFGPVLLSRVLDLNETQSSSLALVFHFADRAGLPLVDLKDLRAVVQFLVSPDGKDELRDAPDDAKALRAAVSTFPKSGYDLEELLTTPGIGEAVVTVLGENGAPTRRPRPPLTFTRRRGRARSGRRGRGTPGGSRAGAC